MEVRLVDPSDDGELAEWAAVLRASDEDLWPDLAGFALPDIRAFARLRGRSKRYDLLAAREPGGPILGVAMMEFRCATTCAAPKSRWRSTRRTGDAAWGRPSSKAMAEQGRADGRAVLNAIVDVPLAGAADHPSLSFAPKVGFEAILAATLRHLGVPMARRTHGGLRSEVARARGPTRYRVLTFEAPWPAHYLQDQCALFAVHVDRRATRRPGPRRGDLGRRQHAGERCPASPRGARYLIAVAQHIASGRLVACTELSIGAESPWQAWQMLTVVHPEHRGHRLGLAIKLANLDSLARHAPRVRSIVTGNAAVNAPMIAVNDMMGFEVAGEGHFWQKRLDES